MTSSGTIKVVEDNGVRVRGDIVVHRHWKSLKDFKEGIKKVRLLC